MSSSTYGVHTLTPLVLKPPAIVTSIALSDSCGTRPLHNDQALWIISETLDPARVWSTYWSSAKVPQNVIVRTSRSAGENVLPPILSCRRCRPKRMAICIHWLASDRWVSSRPQLASRFASIPKACTVVNFGVLSPANSDSASLKNWLPAVAMSSATARASGRSEKLHAAANMALTRRGLQYWWLPFFMASRNSCSERTVKTGYSQQKYKFNKCSINGWLALTSVHSRAETVGP